MRRLRFVPEGGALVEVTCRTLHGRFLLRPSTELNTLVIGVLARAQRLYRVRICAFAFLSNHFHLLLSVDDGLQLARFMGYFNSNLAREAGRLANWRERFWSRRYESILVTNEDRAQVQRLKYVLSQGCKEGLVRRPQDWPGVHSVRAMLGEEALEGLWFDRTREYAARRRGQAFERFQYASVETLVLSPLPAWEHLSPDAYRSRIAALVAEVEIEAAAAQDAAGISPLGHNGIRSQSFYDRPARMKKSPAPFCHAATKAARRELRLAYHLFLAAFRDAAEKLKLHGSGVVFPPGSFPPALPFVGG